MRFEKNPFSLNLRNSEEVEKSFKALLGGLNTSKEALSMFEVSQSFTTGEKNTNFVSVKEHELMCPLKIFCSF